MSIKSGLDQTIEYWDLERKRYPHIEHCAVICAEEITGRFLNVISLFNGSIPLIAIQVKAVQIEGKVSLFFTKVLDEVKRGLPEETDSFQTVTRATWEQNASKDFVDSIEGLAGKLAQHTGPFDLTFTKNYIGCAVNGRSANFMLFRKQQSGLRFDICTKFNDEQIEALEKAGVIVLSYNRHWSLQPVKLSPELIKNPPKILIEVVKQAFDEYFN